MKRIFLTAFIASATLISCNNAEPAPYEMQRHSHDAHPQEQVIKPYYPIKVETPYTYLSKTEIVEIDSCEWISGYGGSGCDHDGGPILAHRGHCKFCAQRNEKVIQAVVEKALRAILDSSNRK